MPGSPESRRMAISKRHCRDLYAVLDSHAASSPIIRPSYRSGGAFPPNLERTTSDNKTATSSGPQLASVTARQVLRTVKPPDRCASSLCLLLKHYQTLALLLQLQALIKRWYDLANRSNSRMCKMQDSSSVTPLLCLPNGRILHSGIKSGARVLMGLTPPG